MGSIPIKVPDKIKNIMPFFFLWNVRFCCRECLSFYPFIYLSSNIANDHMGRRYYLHFSFFSVEKAETPVEWLLKNIRSRFQFEIGLILQIKFFPWHYGLASSHLVIVEAIKMEQLLLHYPLQADRSWDDKENMREHDMESSSLATSLGPVYSVTEWW